MEFISKDRTLRRATYGQGKDATTVIVNFGTTDARVTSKLGGDVVLPPWGFVVEGPHFVAFHARSWNTEEYGKGALFTLQAMDDKNLSETRRIRVFHAFGPPALRWRDGRYKVQREQIIQPEE